MSYKKIKLKELHHDIERYLEQDCYCPGEIYDCSGFFYEVYDANDEVILLGEGQNNKFGFVTACIEPKTNQILIFIIDKDQITYSERYDATTNNINNIKLIISNEAQCTLSFDEFKKGDTESALKEILNLADAIEI